MCVCSCVCVRVSQPLGYITSVSAFCHCTLGLQRKQLFLTTLHYNMPLAIELYNSIKSEHCSDSISPTLILTHCQIKVTNNRKYRMHVRSIHRMIRNGLIKKIFPKRVSLLHLPCSAPFLYKNCRIALYPPLLFI